MNDIYDLYKNAKVINDLARDLKYNRNHYRETQINEWLEIIASSSQLIMNELDYNEESSNCEKLNIFIPKQFLKLLSDYKQETKKDCLKAYVNSQIECGWNVINEKIMSNKTREFKDED